MIWDIRLFIIAIDFAIFFSFLPDNNWIVRTGYGHVVRAVYFLKEQYFSQFKQSLTASSCNKNRTLAE